MFCLKGNYAMAIQDPAIAAEREKVEFKRAMNPCPIDFSELQTTNPRAAGEQSPAHSCMT